MINVYGPTAIRVGANIEEQDKVFCDLAKVTTAHIASTHFYITSNVMATGMPMALIQYISDMHSLFVCNTAFEHPVCY